MERALWRRQWLRACAEETPGTGPSGNCRSFGRAGFRLTSRCLCCPPYLKAPGRLPHHLLPPPPLAFFLWHFSQSEMLLFLSFSSLVAIYIALECKLLKRRDRSIDTLLSRAIPRGNHLLLRLSHFGQVPHSSYPLFKKRKHQVWQKKKKKQWSGGIMDNAFVKFING